MKKLLKSSLCLILTLLLVAPWALLSPVFAAEEVTLLPGQKLISVNKINLTAAPDGVIDGDEYGSIEPTLRLTAENGGFWAEDMEGNPLTKNLPEYVDLYLAQMGQYLYAALKVSGEADKSNKYYLDAFLGFGDDTNAYTINTGNTTNYRMEHRTRSSYLREWWEMRAIELSAKIVAEDGTVTDSQPLYHELYKYMIPNWGKVNFVEDGNDVSVFEFMLDFEDAVHGSGKEWTGEVPDIGYFGFDLSLYNGTTQCGTLHFNTNLSGQKNAPESAPHVLALSEDAEIDSNARIADLASISIERGIISPEFDSEIYDYSVTMAYGYDINVSAEAKAAASGATVKILGAEALGKDQEGVVTVICTAASGYQKTYRIDVKRDYIQSEFAAEGTDGLNSLFTQFGEMEWSAADSVVIRLSGKVESADGLLLGQKTLFNDLGTKLPITIDGGGEAVIELTADTIASANDITFRNLKMPLDGKDLTFFAGAGNVVFENVDFGLEDGKGEASFYGDTNTLDVFEGWTRDNLNQMKVGKTLPTSVTFKGTTRYTPAAGNKLPMGAVGFDGEEFEGKAAISVSPADIAPRFIIDGATVSSVGARVGKAPIPEVNLVMQSGTAQTLSADGMTYSTTTPEKLEGKTFVTVSGGSVVKDIIGLTTAIYKGDVNITVSQADPEVPTEIAAIHFSDRSEIRGSAYLTLLGGTIKGDVVGGTSTIANFNTLAGVTIEGSFYGAVDSARRIVNQVSGANVNGDFVGGGFGSGIFRGVINTVANTVIGNFYGGNRSATLYGTIQNSVSNSSIAGDYYGGNADGTVTDTIVNTLYKTTVILNFYGGNANGTVENGIQNNLNGATITASYYGGAKDGVVTESIDNDLISVTVKGSTHCGNDFGTVKGNIDNYVLNSKFTGFFGGASAHGTVIGNIANCMTGATTFAGYCGGSCTAYVEGTGDIGAVIQGNIANSIEKDSTAKKSPTFGAASGGIAYEGGNRSNVIEGCITNTFDGGTYKSRVFGGSASAQTSISGNEKGVAIVNIINDGNFGKPPSGSLVSFSGGSLGGAIKGDVVTTINGGRFSAAVSFGSRVATTDGILKGLIKGGEFQDAVYGGNFGHTATQDTMVDSGKIDLTIEGGKFLKNVYAGGKTKNVITDRATLTINGGEFQGNVVTGSESNTSNNVQVIINPTKALSIAGTVKSRSSSESVTLKGGLHTIALLPTSSLIFDEYDGANQSFTLSGEAVADQIYLQVPAELAEGIDFVGDSIKEETGIWKGDPATGNA